MIVHFALALPMTATLLYTVARCVPTTSALASSRLAAHWMLGLGIVFLWLAVGSGMWAYFTIAHDAEGFASMSRHQNWAWLTVIGYTSCLPLWQRNHPRQVAAWFLLLLWVATLCAFFTGWTGGENVYRHGLGVERLPTITAN